jgi:hypothetical protein
MTGLLGSTVLEVATGLTFVYLLLAIFCTTVNEWIAALFHTRGNMLRQGILQLLDPDGTGAKGSMITEFYSHPLIRALMRDGHHPPYIPARSFAKAIMDLATPGQPGSITFEQLEDGIKKDLPEGSLRSSLLAVIQGADRHIEGAQHAIETWYNDAMERVSGWYKRRTQLWTVLVALAITLAANADTVHIARRLWMEPALRSGFVSTAAAQIPNGAKITDQVAAQALEPIVGWTAESPKDAMGWFERIIGWIFTVVAVSLGAPFWFDVLNRFVNVRSAGKSPGERPK